MVKDKSEVRDKTLPIGTGFIYLHRDWNLHNDSGRYFIDNSLSNLNTLLTTSFCGIKYS